MRRIQVIEPELKDEVDRVLKKAVLFRGIKEADRLKITDSAGNGLIELAAGEVYGMPGERLQNIAIIVRGALRITRLQESGEEHLIQKLQKGYMAGIDIVYTTTQINPYYIYAGEETLLWEMPASELLHFGGLDDDARHRLIGNLIEFLANENVRKQFKVDVLSRTGLRDRIMAYLMTRSQKLGKNEFSIPFDREEMANYLCVNRSALSHELSKMRREGMINFKKNNFCIISVDKE